MQTFKDAVGDEWVVELDTTTTRSVRKELGVDLLKLDDQSLTQLVSDDEKLVDVISFICTEQIKRKSLDEKGFAKRLVGDAIDNACDALMAEVVFISRHAQRQIVAAAWEKTKTSHEMLTAKMLTLLNSGVVEQKVNEAMSEFQEQLGISSTSVQ